MKTAHQDNVGARRGRRLVIIVAIGLFLILGLLTYKIMRKSSFVQALKNEETVESVISKYGESARQRLQEKFQKAGISYPPKRLLLLGLKAETNLEVYASDDQKVLLAPICIYPILGNSGTLGPKLREGDGQMPEGFYRIRELEPNTPFHVAMRVNYPSDFDKKMGEQDARSNLGSDIMIHGANCSIGCLAMGDPASEELFVLVNDVGIGNTELLMSPLDFRKPPADLVLPDSPAWISGVYADLKERILKLPELKTDRSLKPRSSGE